MSDYVFKFRMQVCFSKHAVTFSLRFGLPINSVNQVWPITLNFVLLKIFSAVMVVLMSGNVKAMRKCACVAPAAGILRISHC